MIQTNPSYTYGDHLTIGGYFRRAARNERFLYSSRWKWWKKTTLYASVPLGVGSALLFAALLYQELGLREETDWALVVSCSLLPFIFFLPIVWAVTYWLSFVAPKQALLKMEEFIARYIPDATHVARYSITNHILERKGTEFEVDYTLVPERNSKGGKSNKQHASFILVFYYRPLPGTESRWRDKNGNMPDAIRKEWEMYCADKESCKPLVLTDYAMYARFKEKALSSPCEVTDALDQMQYLAKRFNCLFLPLTVKPSLEERICQWLRAIDQPVPADITAIHIGMFETAGFLYMLYLTGARRYDEHNDDWACAEDFVPEQKYADLYVKGTEDMEWEELLPAVTDIVSRYVEQRAEDASSLFYHKIVTIGFDEGDLTRIR